MLLGGRAQNTLRRSSLQKHTHLLSRTLIGHQRNTSAALWERPSHLLARSQREVSSYLLRSRLPEEFEALRGRLSHRVGFIALPPCDVVLARPCFWNRSFRWRQTHTLPSSFARHGFTISRGKKRAKMKPVRRRLFRRTQKETFRRMFTLLAFMAELVFFDRTNPCLLL